MSDPKALARSLGPYVPQNYVSIHKVMDDVLLDCCWQIRDRLILETKEVELSKDDLKSFRDVLDNPLLIAERMNTAQWCWTSIRDTLIEGVIDAGVFTYAKEFKKIDRLFWISLEASEALASGQLKGSALFPYSGTIFISEIDFDRTKKMYNNILQDRDSIAPDTKSSKTEDFTSQAMSPKRSGRPPIYDVEKFLLEAMFIIFNEGATKTQAELREKTRKLYAASGASGGEPSEEWAKKKISALWNKLQLRNE